MQNGQNFKIDKLYASENNKIEIIKISKRLTHSYPAVQEIKQKLKSLPTITMKSDSSSSSEDDSSIASGTSVGAPNLDAAVARALVLSGRRMPLAVELLEAIHGKV